MRDNSAVRAGSGAPSGKSRSGYTWAAGMSAISSSNPDTPMASSIAARSAPVLGMYGCGDAAEGELADGDDMPG